MMRMTAAVMHEQGLPAPYVRSTPFRIEEVELDGPAKARSCGSGARGFATLIFLHRGLEEAAVARGRRA
jgi:hypothetical protein